MEKYWVWFEVSKTEPAKFGCDEIVEGKFSLGGPFEIEFFEECGVLIAKEFIWGPFSTVEEAEAKIDELEGSVHPFEGEA